MEKVIFDTNAYRDLVSNIEYDEIDKKIKKIRSKEKRKGIESLISPIVAKELLAHVTHESNPNYNECFKAIKALYLHSGNKNSYRLLASPEMLIAKTFFNQTIPSKIETNKALIQMVYYFSKNPSDLEIKKLQRNLNFNKEHVIETENNFASTMWQMIKQIDPEASNWKIY